MAELNKDQGKEAQKDKGVEKESSKGAAEDNLKEPEKAKAKKKADHLIWKSGSLKRNVKTFLKVAEKFEGKQSSGRKAFRAGSLVPGRRGGGKKRRRLTAEEKKRVEHYEERISKWHGRCKELMADFGELARAGHYSEDQIGKVAWRLRYSEMRLERAAKHLKKTFRFKSKVLDEVRAELKRDVAFVRGLFK